jgi:hypothetical protein
MFAEAVLDGGGICTSKDTGTDLSQRPSVRTSVNTGEASCSCSELLYPVVNYFFGISITYPYHRIQNDIYSHPVTTSNAYTK